MQDIIEYTLLVATEFDRLYHRPIFIGGEGKGRSQIICKMIAEDMERGLSAEATAWALWENGAVE